MNWNTLKLLKGLPCVVFSVRSDVQAFCCYLREPLHTVIANVNYLSAALELPAGVAAADSRKSRVPRPFRSGGGASCTQQLQSQQAPTRSTL